MILFSSLSFCFGFYLDVFKTQFDKFCFEDFVKNDIQKTFDEASDKFDLEFENLTNQDFSFDEQKPTTIELDELIDEYSKNQSQYLELLSKQKDYLIGLFNSKKSVETINSIEIENTPKTQILNLIKNLKEANEKLEVQSIEEDLKPLNKELNQLNGDKKIFDFKPKLGREIYRQKKIKLLNKCISKCNTRTITTLSND